ncbi:MAG: nucleotidyl transferase AbiEii/AbiGii toxin family protein [Microthrixaceae bacterium]
MFRGAILTAAENLNIQPLAVEKDYWVCEALRAIVTTHPGEIVFKGGTSLEKLRIIRRFSEDLDLLVVGSYPSNRAQQKALREMLAAAANATGAGPSSVTSGGNPGSFHRAGYLEPPLRHRVESDAFADPAAILVELGQSGGPNPHRVHEVASMLSRELRASGFDTDRWVDLAPFDVEILHPGRTLIEKLLRVNNYTSTRDADSGDHNRVRIGRQFYDIWALLGAPVVTELLGDRKLVRRILASAQSVSASIGRPDQPVPTGGFARSDAFNPDSPFASQLRQAHDRAMRVLYYGTDQPPTFDEVLARVSACSDLLNIAIHSSDT